MFGSWRRMPVLLVMPAVMPAAVAAAVAAAAVGIAGCGGTTHGQAGASSAKPAGTVAQTNTFTAAKLRGALLTKVNGMSAAMPAEFGSYSSLPDVEANQRSMHGVAVTPKACAQASATGFNGPALAGAPAAAVAFRVGNNGVSEVLVAPPASAANAALGSQVPFGCDHYQATVGGKTFRYSVRESSVIGIGQRARTLNVRTMGYPNDDVWSVVYRGSGFVGAVTVVGPNASATVVYQIGQQAYEYAARSLS
jgi:hypothetical protein